ncbi:MAG: hypothetical protein FWF77_00295 [Defluviitaleaceae bacterium]|nr:hypothetical protein [Defluviitaleaceae bacterium]
MKKSGFFAICAVFIFALLLCACAGELDDVLVGTWHWEADGAFMYVFSPDGTGKRGFPEDMQAFSWSTRAGGILSIDSVREERWDYLVWDGVLVLESRQVAGAAAAYVFAGAGEFSEELTAWNWAWDEDFRFIYIFEPDGTGFRGNLGDGMAEEITWFTNGSRLHVYSPEATFGVRGEMWTFSTGDGVLTLQSEQWDGVVYTYHAFRWELPLGDEQ